MWQLISKFVMLIGMINANQICTWPFYEPEVPSVLKGRIVKSSATP